MKKVVTFGEIMLRLSPPGFLRFGQTKSLDMTFGGGEANVAVSLANFGMETDFRDAPAGKRLGERMHRLAEKLWRRNGKDPPGRQSHGPLFSGKRRRAEGKQGPL